MIDSFIPAELAVAPNPLGLAPNLKLTTIPVDANTCFELWMPNINAILMREEAQLLASDRPRIEEICARLIWLMGAHLVGTGSPLPTTPIYDWRKIRQSLQQADPAIADFNAIGIAHTPYAICPENPAETEFSSTWTLYPPTWEIFFINLHPLQKGFQVRRLPIHATITLGESVTKCEKGSSDSTNTVVMV